MGIDPPQLTRGKVTPSPRSLKLSLPRSPNSGNSVTSVGSFSMGNKRKAVKKNNARCCLVYGVTVLACITILRLIYETHFAGYWLPDIDEEGKVRRRPDRHYQKLNPDQKTTPYDAILEAYFTLIDLKISPSGLQGTGNKYNVQAVFCQIDWRHQQNNPSNVPMFRDLIEKSSMCSSTSVSVDFYDMVRAAKEYDAAFVAGTKTNKIDTAVQAVPPTGVIFHETRCGSTLVANMLASFAPENSRVYSESPPPVTAIRACDMQACNPQLQQKLIQDVFYMMGRTVRKEKPQYVFYKIQSIGVMNIDKFTEAFPSVPWVYLYRDSVEVMQSHVGVTGKIAASGRRKPVCARNYGGKYQPPTTLQLIERKRKDINELTLVEYCAAHLAGLSLSAIQEYERTKRGRFVNYAQLPYIIWDDIVPKYFKVAMPRTGIANMEKAALVYSKGRGDKANQEWKEDSTKKKETARPVVTTAAGVFLGDIYDKMEELSKFNRRGRVL